MNKKSIAAFRVHLYLDQLAKAFMRASVFLAYESRSCSIGQRAAVFHMQISAMLCSFGCLTRCLLINKCGHIFHFDQIFGCFISVPGLFICRAH